MLRIFFIIIGFLSLFLGLLGVALPILPTFPFLLLSAYCFLKYSDRLHAWFTKTKLYRKYVKDFDPKRGMTLKAKLIILIPVNVILAVLFFSYDILAMRITIVVLAVIKLVVFVRMKTIR